MRVLLTDGSGVTSRQTASQLRRLGHDVGVVSADPLGIARFSNAVSHWHRVPPFGADPLVWLDAAIAVYTDHEYDVLLPTQEQVTVLSWSRDRGTLDDVRTAVPSFSALAQVQDKAAATRTLAKLGLPQPPSEVVPLDALRDWERLPVYVKAPIGTASSGVAQIATREDADRIVRAWRGQPERVVVQAVVEGPLLMVQAVFDRGRLVACHANLRRKTGVRGSACHKTSVCHDDVVSVFESLGAGLDWHGALSGDVILADDGPMLIDINPRLVEPENARRSGVDLVQALLDVACDEAPSRVPPGRAGVRTHQLLLAMLGAVEAGRGRLGVARELATALLRTHDYADSSEEFTPVSTDWRGALPLAAVSASLLLRPASSAWFSSGSVSSYAITPAGWARLVRDSPRGA